MIKQSIPSILIIEDSASQALRLQLMLQRAGYTVLIAKDGSEGWQQAYMAHPAVILLDVNLPAMNGFQVLAYLKKNHATARIPVIMLTTMDRITDVEEALALGADGYLFKDDCLFRSEGGEQILEEVSHFLAA
jgi:CheY-like chemotaxis protein